MESFEGLQDEPTRRELLMGALELQEYEDNDTIIEQGDVGDSMFFLESGRAEAEIEGVGVVKEYSRPGDFFGELALTTFSHHADSRDLPHRGATVSAVGPASCYVLRRDVAAAAKGAEHADH